MSAREDNDWIEARRSIVIAQPRDRVFAFVCDPRSDGKWLTNLGDVQWLTPGPFRAGSRFRQFPIFLGARVEVEWEVTAFEADAHFSGRSVSGPITFERSIDCEMAETATRLTKFVRMRAPFVVPFMPLSAANGLLGNATDRALARLKALLEGAAADPGVEPPDRS